MIFERLLLWIDLLGQRGERVRISMREHFNACIISAILDSSRHRRAAEEQTLENIAAREDTQTEFEIMEDPEDRINGILFQTLRPFAFSSEVGTGAALEVVTLSPNAFLQEILFPRALVVSLADISNDIFLKNEHQLSFFLFKLETLSPRAFLAAILSPNALIARVLSPTVFRLEVLSPRAMHTWIVSPEAFVSYSQRTL